jgi:hypothetical protein
MVTVFSAAPGVPVARFQPGWLTHSLTAMLPTLACATLVYQEMPREALFLAAKAYQTYRLRGGAKAIPREFYQLPVSRSTETPAQVLGMAMS